MHIEFSFEKAKPYRSFLHLKYQIPKKNLDPSFWNNFAANRSDFQGFLNELHQSLELHLDYQEKITIKNANYVLIKETFQIEMEK